MSNKNNDQLKDNNKEKLQLDLENMKEIKIIQFLGGKLSVYLLVMIILLFLAIWLYNQISGVLEPVSIIISSLIAPVLVAYIFFYILKPITNFLVNRFNINRGFASILSIVFGIAAIIAIIVGAVPAMVEQTQHLITSMPGYFNTIKEYLAQNSDKAIFKNLTDYINENLNTTQMSAKAFDIFSGIVTGAGAVFSSLATVFMTAPFVLYYLLKDSSKFKEYAISKLPKNAQQPIEETLDEIDSKVGSYISGQMLVSLCIGLLLFIGYQIIGLQYAVSLATLAAVLSIVPYLGPILAITPAMLVAFATDWIMVVKMLVVWFVVQFLEGNFISPNIMGRSMNQHPLTVIFVIIIAANMMGIVGAIIGIPLYAILKILLGKIFTLLRKRYDRIYRGIE